MISVGMAAMFTALAVFVTVYAVKAPVHEVPKSDFYLDGTAPVGSDHHGSGGLFDRLVRPIVRNFLPQTPMSALVKARNSTKIQELLVRSGNPWNIQPEEYLGVQIFAAVAGFFVTFLLYVSGMLESIQSSVPLPPWAFLVIGSLIGSYVPKVLLDRAKGARVKEARRGLPEALDLMVITLNAGMNFGPALAEVVKRLPEGLIKEELTRVSLDIRAGRGLKDSLLDFARRAPSDEVESFCKAVVTAEDLGADVTDILTAQSESARQAYEASLDEKIGKLPTTLFFPILGLMLPALFIVILAPAFSNIASAF